MFNPLPLRIRGLFLLVALVAVAIALVSEFKRHSDLQMVRSREVFYWTAAAWHFKQADRCASGILGKESYSYAQRLAETSRNPIGIGNPAISPKHTTWDDERFQHLSWGARLQDQAAWLTTRRQTLEQRLLFP